MKSLNNKIIVYDSNCKVCTSFRDVLLKSTAIPMEKVTAYKDLPPKETFKVDTSRFKNGMALVDTLDDDTLYGSEGVAYILSTEYRLVDLLLRSGIVFAIFNFFYNLIAYNRYLIATPRSAFACDCLPDKVLKYRLSYIFITVFLSVLLTAWLGMSLATFFEHVTLIEAMSQMILVAGTGWVLQILFAMIFLRENALDYIGHLGSIMVVGLLILVPWMLWETLGGSPLPQLPAVSVIVSSSTMLYLHYNRIRYLGLRQTWTVSWLLLLQGTAFAWIYFFHLT